MASPGGTSIQSNRYATGLGAQPAVVVRAHDARLATITTEQ
jgi:hypothetical protein